MRDVLGIKNIFFKNSVPATLPASKSESKTTLKENFLLIQVDGLETYSAAETELLKKMTAAFQLTENQIKIADLKDQEQPHQFKLILSDVDSSLPDVESRVAVTYSPRRLLKDSHLKKEAWSIMKLLIQKIEST